MPAWVSPALGAVGAVGGAIIAGIFARRQRRDDAQAAYATSLPGAVVALSQEVRQLHREHEECLRKHDECEQRCARLEVQVERLAGVVERWEQRDRRRQGS